MLTDKRIKAMKPADKVYLEADATGQRGTGRLLIRVRTNGTKEWMFRYFLDKRKQHLKIGTYPSMTLTDARKESARLSALLQAGEDPGAVYRAERTASSNERTIAREVGTLADLAAAYSEDMKARGKRSHEEPLKVIRRYVEKPFPHLWKAPARDITSSDIRDVLAFHINRGVTTNTNRARSWLHRIFQYALSSENDPRHQSERKWLITANPVSVVPRQADWERAGERVMTAEEIRHAWHHLEETPNVGPLVASAIKLVIATAGQRPLSLLRLEPADIDFEMGVIDINAEDTKTEKAHVVPLTQYAIDILVPLIEQAERKGFKHLFETARRPGEHINIDSVSKGAAHYCKHFGIEKWTPRDIRRTAKTVLGQEEVPKDLRDRLHGHAMNDVSSQHYDRYDYLREKRQAMDVWEKWLGSV